MLAQVIIISSKPHAVQTLGWTACSLQWPGDNGINCVATCLLHDGGCTHIMCISQVRSITIHFNSASHQCTHQPTTSQASSTTSRRICSHNPIQAPQAPQAHPLSRAAALTAPPRTVCRGNCTTSSHHCCTALETGMHRAKHPACHAAGVASTTTIQVLPCVVYQTDAHLSSRR